MQVVLYLQVVVLCVLVVQGRRLDGLGGHEHQHGQADANAAAAVEEADSELAEPALPHQPTSILILRQGRKIEVFGRFNSSIVSLNTFEDFQTYKI